MFSCMHIYIYIYIYIHWIVMIHIQINIKFIHIPYIYIYIYIYIIKQFFFSIFRGENIHMYTSQKSFLFLYVYACRYTHTERPWEGWYIPQIYQTLLYSYTFVYISHIQMSLFISFHLCSAMIFDAIYHSLSLIYIYIYISLSLSIYIYIFLYIYIYTYIFVCVCIYIYIYIYIWIWVYK